MRTLRVRKWAVPSAAALILGLSVVPVALGSTAGASSGNPPTQGIPTPHSVGKTEGALNLIAWEGYAQPQWVNPFQKATGCHVNVKYAGSSSEMVSLMANGGGHQYDLVSASGDADLRLIYGGNVKPINIRLIPSWKNFHSFLRKPAFNTINGYHYGISYEFGPNVLLYSTKTFPKAPTSWSVLYSSKYKGKVTIPNNPIQIADAALYLSKTKPGLKITDPYELTKAQFSAAVNLLKSEHGLIKKYWDLASQEISLFQNGETVVGAGWNYQTNTLKAAGAKVADTIPREGATGWADTWLMATNAPHPNCAYRWMQWVSTPRVQAEEAIFWGETPANTLACPIMNQLQKGGCAAFHANAPASYFATIKFWKTPLPACGNGKSNCMSFTQWQQAWTQITG